jgi:hypothetical protein
VAVVNRFLAEVFAHRHFLGAHGGSVPADPSQEGDHLNAVGIADASSAHAQ